MMIHSIISSASIFFSQFKVVFLTVHLIAVAIGIGGATITDVLFFNFLRDFRISKKEQEVMNMLSNVMMIALILLYISGLALYLANAERLRVSPAFLSKVCIVVVLTINGILMHKHVAPKMMHLSFLLHPLQTPHLMHRLRKVSFMMGSVSFVSWYSVFLIATLKSHFPVWVGLSHILGTYAVVLVCAMITSQIMEWHLHKKSAL